MVACQSPHPPILPAKKRHLAMLKFVKIIYGITLLPPLHFQSITQSNKQQPDRSCKIRLLHHIRVEHY